MRDLAAQVTSSLLRFPEVTVNALLGEDEITLDSVLHGRLALGRSNLAWLACGPHLEVVHSVTGERFSAYRFSGMGEHPPSVLAVRDFSWLKRTGLLVGLEEAEGSLLCLYDLSISRVVKAVVIPGRITCVEPLVGYGGANASTQHLHQSLRWFFGVAAVVTDVGHVLLVDLCLDDLSLSQSELEASDLEVVSKSPADVPRLRESVTRQGRHLCLQLSSPTGTGATALHYIARTNQLAAGFSDGCLQLWNMKTLKKEYHSQLEGGRIPVHAFTFQEPENDPRNCCYLWAVQSAQDHEGDVVSLHLLQLAFGERKCLPSGKILYEGLEYCEERYSQDLNGGAFPLRAQATSTRLLGCQTIEKFRHHPDRDDTVNEVVCPDTSVSIFAWQVKAYGQGRPSTYIGVFDINRWYHAQMPDSLRAGESLHSCPYLAVWSLDAVAEMTSPCLLLDVAVHERSLSRGLPYTCPPPEQFFNPTTYNFDATCLLNVGVVHVTCSGYQKETLSFLKRSAPYLKEAIPDSYSRCLMSGLLSSRLADVQPSSLSQEEQLDAILCTAVETSSLGLITGYVRQWMAEDEPRAAVNLRHVLEWAWRKVVLTKEELDSICAPLFDGSSNFTDPQTLRLLQHSQRLLGNLSTVFHCLLSEAQDLTHAGLVSLINKKMVSSLIAQYSQVVLWFCRTGLLPEGTDDGMLQISRPFYNYSVIKNYYTGRREELQRLSRGQWWSDCLMIDGLVAQLGERLACLWKRDEDGTGEYPPPTLHALLDIYLLENVEESAKHAIVLYLLLDVMYSYPSKSGVSVESFPTAFAIPIGLVKLVQGLWLLDHHDHENSLELLLHPSTSRSLWAWQHERILQALMCQGQPGIALRYLHTMRPHMTSASQLKLCLTVLVHNRCMVEAWALLRQHRNKTNVEEMLRFLYETCQALGLMKELLKLPLEVSEQETLERFLQASGEPQNKELLIVHYLQQSNYVPALQVNQALKMNLVNDRDPKMKERSNTRNSILDQYGKILPRVQRRLATERTKPYRHPSTVFREVSRPQPLSTVAKRSAAENVLTRAAFIGSVLTKIGEVWAGKDRTPECSPLKSPRIPELPLPTPCPSVMDLPEAFVGTPIASTSKSRSRVLDLVVRPSSQAASRGPSAEENTPRHSASGTASSPTAGASSYFRGIAKAPELSLLQTPQVVKRARALAASASMFSSFTPQSILRSSLRPTPVASPSASPGRSASPPPRPKENRITFIEEASSPPDSLRGVARWDATTAGDGSCSLLSRSSLPRKSMLEDWAAPPQEEEEEEEIFISPAKEVPGGESHDIERGEKALSESCAPGSDVTDMAPMSVAGRVSLGFETSQASVHSVDTTLEYHDAPLPEALTEEIQQDVRDIGSPEMDAPQRSPSPATQEEMLTTPADLHQGVENEGRDWAKEPKPDHEEAGVLVPVQDISQNVDSEWEVSPPEQGQEQEGAEEQRLEEEGAQKQRAEERAVTPTEGLDEFVERHLFEDLSPPLIRSSIREASQTWASFSDKSEFSDKDEEDREQKTNAALPAEASVSSGTSTDSSTDSHSVVSLIESGDSSTSEEDLDDPTSEDSGSEVEIIEEVKGNGRHPSLTDAAIFLEEQPLDSEFFETQADVVLSPVDPEVQLKSNSVAETEEAVLMLNAIEAEDGDEGEPVFAELKPSATLLIPLEQDDGNQAEASLELRESDDPEVPHVEPLGNFTLMLETDDGDNGMDTDLMIMAPPITVDVNEKHDDGELRRVVEHATDIVYLDIAQDDHVDMAPPTVLPDDGKILSRQLEERAPKEGFTDRSEGESLLSQQNFILAFKEPPPFTADTEVLSRVQGDFSKAAVQSCEMDAKTPGVDGVPALAEEAPVSTAEQEVAELEVAQVVTMKQADIPEAEAAVEIAGTTTAALEVKMQNSEGTTSAVNEEHLNEENATTGGRVTRSKVMFFPSPINEAEKDTQSEEEKVLEHTEVPSTPRRSARRNKYGQDFQVPFTPRRSTRRASESSHSQKEEKIAVGKTSNPSPESSEPQIPQKATPRKGTRKTRNTSVAMEDVKEEEELPVTRARSARKSKPLDTEEPAIALADLEVRSSQPAKAPSSPSRMTRKSSRGVTLALEPPHLDSQEEHVVFPQDVVTPRRITKKEREVTVEKTENALAVAEEPVPLLSISRRSTRSQLWNHLSALEEKKERPLLETTLEVEPGTQLADAVMERLKDAKEGWKDSSSVVVHTRGGATKAKSHELPAIDEVQEDARGGTTATPVEKREVNRPKAQKPSRRTRASKITSPVRDTFILSPPQTRRKTRGRATDSAVQEDDSAPQFVFSPPVTRARRPAIATAACAGDSENAMGDAVPEAEEKGNEAVKPRRKRAVKAKAAGSAPPPVEINLISPPAEATFSRVRNREEAEPVTPRTNLRRKRLLEAVFPKPVTRRKMF